MKKYFNTYLDEIKKNNFDYRPELIGRQTFLDARLLYFTEVIRQSCFSSKKLVVVTENCYIDQILNNWKGLQKEIRSLDSFYMIKSQTFDAISFVDYIEKIVIIDLMLDNYVKDNFVDYKVCY